MGTLALPLASEKECLCFRPRSREASLDADDMASGLLCQAEEWMGCNGWNAPLD